MFGQGKYTRKFSPLHMDDGEEFIMEFRGETILENPQDPEVLIKSKATLNFCSKSVIIELEENSEYDSLFKYYFRFMTEAPKVHK